MVSRQVVYEYRSLQGHLWLIRLVVYDHMGFGTNVWTYKTGGV